MKSIRVFFFGDSICVGQHVALHRGWVCRTSAELYQLGTRLGREIVVTNASANGRTTREALCRIEYEVQSQNPDLTIIQFGMNDCNYWTSDGGLPRVSPASFRANTAEIILRALTFGSQRILLNTNHPTARTEENLPFSDRTYQQSNEHYNHLIREVSAEAGPEVILNDIEKAFLDETSGSREALLDLLLPPPDLLHLSERGHEVYFSAFYPVLEQAVLDILQEEET